MQTILSEFPPYLVKLIEALRAKLHAQDFLARHRVRPQDFTRQRQLTFPVLMLFVLQQTIKSLQRHLNEFLNELASGGIFESVTAGALTHARAKLKNGAFIELNRDCVLPTIYSSERPVRRWRTHRLIGIDSSLLRLPDSQELGAAFGWKEAANQHGATGTRFAEARLSVIYDLLNDAGLDCRVEPSTLGEVQLAMEQLQHLQQGDVAINDRGFTGFVYLASVVQRGAHAIGRCSTGSFRCAQELFRLNRTNQSRIVWLFAPPDQKAQCRRLGLPLKLKARFVSVRLPTGELEVLVTTLLDETAYPTEEFLEVYHYRWGHETFHLMLKGRLELENFSGRTTEAVRQDVQAAVLLANLETLLSEPAQSALEQQRTPESQPLRVNRSNSYHGLKLKLLELLYSDTPPAVVLSKLMVFFQGSPVATRPERQAERRRKPSFNRSYHFQRRVKKLVF